MINMDKTKHFLCSDFGKNFESMHENVKVCEYSDLSTLTNYNPSTDTLFILHINIRSIQKHIDVLCELISNLSRSPDVILTTETRIQEAPAVNIEIQGYNLKFANSPTKAGGVAMYFTKDINFEIAPVYNLEIKGGESSSQFQWFTIAKIEL